MRVRVDNAWTERGGPFACANVGVHLWMDIVWNMEARNRVTGEISEKSVDSHAIALFPSRVFV